MATKKAKDEIKVGTKLRDRDPRNLQFGGLERTGEVMGISVGGTRLTVRWNTGKTTEIATSAIPSRFEVLT